MTTKTSYSTLQITLHWTIAILILAAWWFGDGMGRALRTRIETGQTGFAGNTLHVWLGTAVLVLVLVRIVVRRMQGAPAPLPATTAWSEKTALWGHRLLYTLMLLVPAMGGIVWYFNVGSLGDAHGLVANGLMIVALGHAAFALYHHYIVKDGTLRRMLRPGT